MAGGGVEALVPAPGRVPAGPLTATVQMKFSAYPLNRQIHGGTERDPAERGRASH